MDGEYIATHFSSTIDRLGRFRRKLQIPTDVLDLAASASPPVSGKPKTAHTHPTPDKFLVSENGEVMLVDWEWATLAPPEWDVSLATWSLSEVHDEEGVEAFLAGYGSTMPRSHLDSWTAYHSAVRLLGAAESRDGRLGDLAATVRSLTQAVRGD